MQLRVQPATQRRLFQLQTTIPAHWRQNPPQSVIHSPSTSHPPHQNVNYSEVEAYTHSFPYTIHFFEDIFSGNVICMLWIITRSSQFPFISFKGNRRLSLNQSVNMSGLTQRSKWHMECIVYPRHVLHMQMYNTGIKTCAHEGTKRHTRTHTHTHTHTPRWSLKPKCMTSLGPGSLYGYSVTASLLHPLQRGISGLTSDVSSVTETNTKVISAKSSCWNTRMNGKGKGTVRHWVWNLYIQGYGSMKLYFMIYYYNHNIINILINIIKSY